MTGSGSNHIVQKRERETYNGTCDDMVQKLMSVQDCMLCWGADFRGSPQTDRQNVVK